MPKLSNEEDRKSTRDSASKGGQGTPIKLEEGHNFVVLLEEDYEEGFSHWITIKGKTYRRTCLAGLEAKGWDPESCDLCNLALEMFDLKKAANLDGDKLLAKDYNERGNKIRSNYSSVFKIVKFKAIIERIKDKQGKSVKKNVPDYEEYEVGKMAFTHAQMDKLFNLVEEDEVEEGGCEWITEGKDLIMRVLDFCKAKEGDDTYARLKEIRPSKRKFDIGKLEDFDENLIPDISEEFANDEDLDKIGDLYRAELEGEEEEEYEEEELEKKSSKGKKKTKNKGKPKGVKKASKEDEEEDEEDADLEEEDDFEDDIPF